jgi:[protein-PII] uridylyltransferase
VVADLGRAAAGALDVAAAVAARERRRDERPPLLAAPVPVEVTVEPRAGRTVLEVRAPDSPGLLYRLARALAADGADVAAARVETLGPQARDAFLVREDLDPPRRTALAAALRAAAGG